MVGNKKNRAYNAMYYNAMLENEMAMTSVRMPDEMMDKLDATANKLRRSKGWIIKDAVQQYLEREEQKAIRYRETLEALEDVKAGRLVDGEEVLEWMESWGTDDEKESI